MHESNESCGFRKGCLRYARIRAKRLFEIHRAKPVTEMEQGEIEAHDGVQKSYSD
jgi:hypothetical protein